MKRLEKVFKKLNIEWTDDKAQKYLNYMNEILERNKHINLTAITDEEEFIEKHFIDSLLCADTVEFLEADKIIDIGTGGGFPGIPLAIAFPEKEFVLLDSLNKRIKIINELAEKLGILNVIAVHGRAEEWARKPDMREEFSLCVSRAVANMTTLTEYCLPFVKEGGYFIAYKGPDCEEEVKDAKRAIKLLGGELLYQKEVRSDGSQLRHKLVSVKKIGPTPKKYPRKAGMPSKEPLK